MPSRVPSLVSAPAGWANLGGTFGARDIAGLIFIGIGILVIWLIFLHLQGLTERAEEDEKPPPPPPPAA